MKLQCLATVPESPCREIDAPNLSQSEAVRSHAIPTFSSHQNKPQNRNKFPRHQIGCQLFINYFYSIDRLFKED